MKRKPVLCAIPCYNESYNLPNLFADLERQGVAEVADIVFIDDHSSDETLGMILEQGYRAISHKSNHGYGQAVQTGFAYAVEQNYEAFIIFPGDHQRQAKDLKQLIVTHQQREFDVVTGSKFHIYSEKHGPIKRRIGNIIYSKIAEYGWKSPIQDVLSGFKIYSVEAVLPFFQYLPRGYAFDICFSLYASRFGLRIMETPVACRYDDHTTKMKSVLGTSIKMLMHLIVHLVKQPLFHRVSHKTSARPIFNTVDVISFISIPHITTASRDTDVYVISDSQTSKSTDLSH